MTNRRNFIKASAVGIGALTLASQINPLSAEPKEQPRHDMGANSPDAQLWAKEGKPVRVALIGCGWYGKSDLFRIIQCGGDKINVVALCDVNKKMLDEAGELVAQRQASGKVPQKYKDYRKLLEEQKIDICLIGTPDHWHALPMIAACEAGCDVYVQKPIGCDVVECQAMLAAARKYNRVVQVGMQRRSTPILIEAKRLYIDSGRMGKVALVNLFDEYTRRKRILEPSDPPAELDFDFWTGPAPMRPYYLPRIWRDFMEYGNGTIGDMGVHMFDMTRWLLGLRWPKTISSVGGIYVNKGGTPTMYDTQKAIFQYDDLVVEWQHKHWAEVIDHRIPWGATLYGDKGTLKAGSMAYDYKDQGRSAETTQVDARLEYDLYPSDETEPGLERKIASANRAHMWNFLARTVDRQRPVSDIEEGFISTVCCILANISLELGGATLEFDPETGKVRNNDKANAMLRREYRAPWVHPEV